MLFICEMLALDLCVHTGIVVQHERRSVGEVDPIGQVPLFPLLLPPPRLVQVLGF